LDDTLDEYKADIRAKLIEGYAKADDDAYENEVLEKDAEQMEVEIPEAMVERQVESYVDDFRSRVESQGMKLEQYLELTGMTMESLKKQMRPNAEKGARTALLIENVAKAENIEATDDDLNEEIRSLAEKYSMEEDKVREIVMANPEQIKKDVVFKKTIKFLVDSASAE